MNTISSLPKSLVEWVEITEDNQYQRLDNFLISRLKGVPKSWIYRLVRKGEVRVNKGRVDVSYKLAIGDIVRIPPIRQAEGSESNAANPGLGRILERHILFEDDSLVVINKPAGFAVHGGSGLGGGVIEGLRASRPDQHFLELVHRLDRDTSGCLLIAKKRSALRSLHEQFRNDTIKKTYCLLIAGQWGRKKLWVDQPLLKNVNKGGERVVVIHKQGKPSQTLFRRLQLYTTATLVEAVPKTGRTHQIRVHAAYLNHPIIGDDRYGSAELNRSFKEQGYKNLFLHAQNLTFEHPGSEQTIEITAPLPQHFLDFIAHEKTI